MHLQLLIVHLCHSKPFPLCHLPPLLPTLIPSFSPHQSQSQHLANLLYQAALQLNPSYPTLLLASPAMPSNACVSVSEAPRQPNNWFCAPHLLQQEDQLLAPLNPTSHLVPYSLLITIQWRKYYSSCSLWVNVCVNYGWKCEIYSIYCQPTQPSLKQPKSVHKAFKITLYILPPVRVMLRCPSKRSSASTQQGSSLAPGVLVP